MEDSGRQAALFCTLPEGLAAEVFSRLPGPARARLARALPEGALERLLDALCPRAGGAEARRPYFAASAWEHARRRLVWLLVLMVSAALTGAIITQYEAAISAVPLLVAFLPMLMDTGGNCGSQSAALVIRGLALGEILPRDALRVARRELAVAAIVGAALAGACGLWVLLQYHSWPLALTVALSLAGTVALAKLAGSLLPIAAGRLRLDPAVTASPLITTVVDAGAVLIYFRAAAALLRLPL